MLSQLKQNGSVGVQLSGKDSLMVATCYMVINLWQVILIFSQKQLAQLLNLITPSVLTHSKEVMLAFREIILCLRNQITNRVQDFIYFRWSSYPIKETSPQKTLPFLFLSLTLIFLSEAHTLVF